MPIEHANRPTGQPTPEDPVATQCRWQDGGAFWRVLGRNGGTVTVGLLTWHRRDQFCRFTTADHQPVRLVAGRRGGRD
jgi:hypothetical protein